MLLRYIILACFSCWSLRLVAQNAFLIETETLEGVSVFEKLQYELDPNELKSFPFGDSAFDARTFKTLTEEHKSFGIFEGAIWLRFSLYQDRLDRQTVIVHLGQAPRIAQLAYRYGENGSWQQATAGMAVLKYQEQSIALPSRSASWLVDLPYQKPVEVLLRIEVDQSYKADIRLYDMRSYYKKERLDMQVAGIYQGIMLTLIFIHSILFLRSREASYLYFALTLSFLHLFVLGLPLYGNEYAWWKLSFAESHHLILFKIFGMIAYMAFSRSILSHPSLSTFDKFFNALTVLYAGFAATWFFIDNYAGFHRIFNVFILVGILISLPQIAILCKRLYRPAILFGIAGLPLIAVSITAIILQIIGQSSLMPDINLAIAVAAVFQVLVLSFAIADKLRFLQKAQRANEMTYKQEILSLNAQLESKVQEQTRDIVSMLQHTHLGLLSIQQDLTIHRDYSKHLEQLLEAKDIAGKDISSLLFSKARLGSGELSRLHCALEYSLGEELIFFEANCSNLPTRLELKFEERIKFFDLDWSAIVNEDRRVVRILLGIRDITENLRLQEEAEYSARSLRYTAEILENGPEAFRQLESELYAACRNFESLMEESDSKALQTMYVRLHTLKGRARLHHFSGITDCIHELEEHLDLRGEYSLANSEGLWKDLRTTRRCLRQYGKALTAIENFQNRRLNQRPGPKTLQTLFHDMEPEVDRLARELGKGGCRIIAKIDQQLSVGQELLDALSDAALHLVRNSLDHGLEAPEQRIKAGKTPYGTITVTYEYPDRLKFTDDGQGLALFALKRRAQEKNLVVEDPTALANLLLNAGFSTKTQVDHMSGRGLGMFAVRRLLQDLGCEVRIELVGEPNLHGYCPFNFVIILPKHTVITISSVAA